MTAASAPRTPGDGRQSPDAKPAYVIPSPLRRTLATADHMTTRKPPTPIRLFDDFKRTYYGPADPGEPSYEFLNRFDDPRAEQARALCNQWFQDYANDAPEDELARFLGNFCGKDDGNHYAAWFELMTHQILAKIGFDVTVEPKLELSGHQLTPDFAVTWNGSCIFVEATVVAPDNDPFAPSSCERDAHEKFTQLEIANFTTRIARASGTLKRHLKKQEIEREFERILAKHEPDVVQSRIDRYGHGSLPSEPISFGDWQLLVELWPLPRDKRALRKARVADWPQVRMHDSSVPNAKQKIKKKLRKYRQASSQLILAVNVHNLGGFNPDIDGNDVLFGKDGIWDTNRGSGRQGPLAALFLTDTNSYAVPNTPARLYVNPSLDPATFPQALLRLPHALGPDGSEYHEGESIASILGLD